MDRLFDKLQCLDGFSLTVPFPPSVNGLYDGGKKTKRRFKSDRYQNWLKAAGYTLLAQKRERFPGPIRVLYEFSPPSDGRTRDVFNYEKPVSDLLVAHRIIRDDSQIVEGTVRWVSGEPGVRITIKECP